MEVGASQNSAETVNAISINKQYKNLLELKGQMIVELIESAEVIKPSDTLKINGLGNRIDIHV